MRPEQDGGGIPFGIAMVLLSAVSFGLLTTLARLAYDGGSNSITVAFTRAFFAVAIGVLACLILRRDWRLNRERLPGLVWVAVGQTGMSVFYLGAVQYISVSLGAILFYTYPILVLITEAVLLREVPGRIRIAVFACAFLGLVLALGPSFESMDWRGIAFGFGASVSATILFFAAKHARQTSNELAVVVWGNALSLPVMLAIIPLMGGFLLPETDTGWSGLWLACLFYVVAFLGYAIGMRYIAPARAAMYYNLEPVISIIAASILLSELLTPTQGIGAALVLVALMLSAWRERRGHA